MLIQYEIGTIPYYMINGTHLYLNVTVTILSHGK